MVQMMHARSDILKYLKCDNLLEVFYKLLGIAIQFHGNKIACWFYPDTDNSMHKCSTISGDCKFDFATIEKVTLYDDERYCEQLIYDLGHETISEVIKSIVNVSDLLDSVSIYRHDEIEWFMAIIFHENICIFKGLNGDEERLLTENGFIVSDLPPEDW